MPRTSAALCWFSRILRPAQIWTARDWFPSTNGKSIKKPWSFLYPLCAKWVSKVDSFGDKQDCTFRIAYNFITQDEVLSVGGCTSDWDFSLCHPGVANSWQTDLELAISSDTYQLRTLWSADLNRSQLSPLQSGHNHTLLDCSANRQDASNLSRGQGSLLRWTFSNLTLDSPWSVHTNLLWHFQDPRLLGSLLSFSVSLYFSIIKKNPRAQFKWNTQLKILKK